MRRSLLQIYTASLSIFLLGISVTHAQIPDKDFVNIDVNPPATRTLQPVTVSVRSYSTDLNAATIAWYVNERLVTKAQGLIDFDTTTGKPGSATTVTARIRTVEGLAIEKRLVLKPADVALLWEADGFMPPFYKGRPLFAFQSSVRFTAIPEFIKGGKRMDPKTLIYKWKSGSKILGSVSGYGKQTLDIKGDILPDPLSIGVEVDSPADGLHGEAVYSVDPVAPTIMFYEDDSLYGVLYNRAVTNTFITKNSEIRLRTVPYNFSNSSVTPNGLQYTWNINGEDQSNLTNSPSITFRAKDNTDQTSPISLTIKSAQDLLQSATANFSIELNKQDDSSN